MKPKQLVALCEGILSSYNPLITTPDIHADEFLQNKKLTSHSADVVAVSFEHENENQDEAIAATARDKQHTAEFVREVFYGMQRYEKLIKMVVDGLYDYHKSSVLRADRTLYAVMTYLTLCHLRKGGFAEWKQFVLALPRNQMCLFLGFIVEQDSWMSEQLCLLYDRSHVLEVILGPVHESSTDIRALLESFREELAHKEITATLGQTGSSSDLTASNIASRTALSAKRKTPTQPQPFQLTRPKPRVLPEPPVVFDSDYKSRPVPDFIRSTSLKQIEKEKEDRRELIRQQTVSKLADAAAPKLRVFERPMHLPQLTLQAEQELASHYVRFKAAPAPAAASPETLGRLSAKPTAAQVLREDALFRRKQELEAAVIRAFESELKDASEFVQ